MDINDNLQQEIMDHQYLLEIERKKFIKNKIFLDTLREPVNGGLSSTELQSKLFGSLLKYSISDQDNELFVNQFNDVDLNDHELKILKPQILKQLVGKSDSICSEFKQIIGKSVEDIEDFSSINTDGSLEIYKSLKIQYDLFKNNLEKLKHILEEMLHLQSEKLYDASHEKIEQYKIETKLQLSRAQITYDKIKTDIFTEYNYTLNAYRKLFDDMKEQNLKLQHDIEDLENLKQKYRQISCKQFDELLRIFKQYKLSIEKKKSLLENLS